jgi:hypothetical protein
LGFGVLGSDGTLIVHTAFKSIPTLVEVSALADLETTLSRLIILANEPTAPQRRLRPFRTLAAARRVG